MPLGDRKACMVFGKAERHDVPDHDQADLESLPQAATCALGLPNTTPKSNRNFDDRKASSHGHQEHVRREVVAADYKVGKDLFQSLTPNCPVRTSDVHQAGGTQMTAVPKS